MAMKRAITPADLMSIAEYGKVRAARRQATVARKQHRRLEVGPVATFHFENYDSMWLQIQEMLYIEKGGESQIADELRAYNPLIPQGQELIATVLFEIDDPARRKTFLQRLGGIEETAFIRLAEETIKGVPEADVDRTSADGKASAVQFIHFSFSPEQIVGFRRPNTQVVLGFSHPAYGHMVVMPEAVRSALAEDFD
jgi:Protein of unknown function (DUF3501)